jgi:hypothetical protein
MASTSASAAVGSVTISTAWRRRSAMPETRSASARSARSSSAPVTLAMSRDCRCRPRWSVLLPASAARRRRSRQAVTLVCRGLRSTPWPGPARSPGPGWLQVFRAVAGVVFPVVAIGGPLRAVEGQQSSASGTWPRCPAAGRPSRNLRSECQQACLLSRAVGVAPVRDRQDCDDPRPVIDGIQSTVMTAPGRQDVFEGHV